MKKTPIGEQITAKCPSGHSAHFTPPPRETRLRRPQRPLVTSQRSKTRLGGALPSHLPGPLPSVRAALSTSPSPRAPAQLPPAFQRNNESTRLKAPRGHAHALWPHPPTLEALPGHTRREGFPRARAPGTDGEGGASFPRPRVSLAPAAGLREGGSGTTWAAEERACEGGAEETRTSPSAPPSTRALQNNERSLLRGFHWRRRERAAGRARVQSPGPGNRPDLRPGLHLGRGHVLHIRVEHPF